MSAFSELTLQLREGSDSSITLEEIAAALSGEIDGRVIRCPSPGASSVDRSCHLRINPKYPNDFFIYDCEGRRQLAYEMVRRKLQLLDPPLLQKDNAAAEILAATIPATGTLVERYVRSRSISLPLPPCLRFHPALYHKNSSTCWPAMIAVRTGPYGDFQAIHRTYLRFDGEGKANIDPQRMDLGPTRGGAIRLSPVSRELMIGEGIETTLSAMQACGKNGWAAGSAIALRNAVLPSTVQSVIILADGDDAGRSAARAAASRWSFEGRNVRVAYAPTGRDFNDLLIDGRRS